MTWKKQILRHLKDLDDLQLLCEADGSARAAPPRLARLCSSFRHRSAVMADEPEGGSVGLALIFVFTINGWPSRRLRHSATTFGCVSKRLDRQSTLPVGLPRAGHRGIPGGTGEACCLLTVVEAVIARQ